MLTSLYSYHLETRPTVFGYHKVIEVLKHYCLGNSFMFFINSINHFLSLAMWYITDFHQGRKKKQAFTECLLCARPCAQRITNIVSFDPNVNPRRSVPVTSERSLLFYSSFRLHLLALFIMTTPHFCTDILSGHCCTLVMSLASLSGILIGSGSYHLAIKS